MRQLESTDISISADATQWPRVAVFANGTRQISRRRFCLITAAVISGAGTTAYAEGFNPNRPVVLTAPAAAGGLTDILARSLAVALGKQIGATVVVENKDGAGGRIGMTTVARAQPDGHSLILVFQGPATVAPSLYPDLPYDTFKDFAAIGMVGAFHNVLTVGSASPFHNAKDIIEAAKRRPGELTFGSAGVGTSGHLAGELFQREAGITLNHVAYKGEAPALKDVSAGLVDLSFSTLAGTRPLADAGRVRIVGLASTSRTSFAPGVPTISETAVPGFNLPGWFGLMAPRQTPDAVLADLRRALATTLKDAGFRARLAEISVEPSAMTVQQFEEWLQQDTARWRAVIAKANLKPQ